MSNWPELSVARDAETFGLLHLVSQMLGKLRVAQAAWVNHGWHATLHVAPEGLAIAPAGVADRRFALTIDLCAHELALRVQDGARDRVALRPASVAELHGELIGMLDRHGLPSRFHGTPNEIDPAVPFAEDRRLRDYRPDSAERLRDALNLVAPLFEEFRAGFQGKVSPVHFFWGSFDLAVTRFSGRTAPRHPGGIPGLPDRITREAYSHEVSSAGFWPGGLTPAEPIFYSYAYPEPDGFRGMCVLPDGASFDDTLGEFVLPYDEVRRARDPAKELMRFLTSTYEAAADLADWDRLALERKAVAP